MRDLAEAKPHGSFVRGVKGESYFTQFPTIDMVWGFPLNYLHNGLFGVTEQVWANWNALLKPAQRKVINDLLFRIQPPRDLRRCTDKVLHKSVWKATHWKA